MRDYPVKITNYIKDNNVDRDALISTLSVARWMIAADMCEDILSSLQKDEYVMAEYVSDYYSEKGCNYDRGLAFLLINNTDLTVAQMKTILEDHREAFKTFIEFVK